MTYLTFVVIFAGSFLFAHVLPQRARHRAERACGCVCGYIAYKTKETALVCLPKDDPDPAAHFRQLREDAR